MIVAQPSPNVFNILNSPWKSKCFLYFLNVGALTTSSCSNHSSLQLLQCGHWLNWAAVKYKPLSSKPNNLLFCTGETQAGHCMSGRDPWVLINGVAGPERAGKGKRLSEWECSLWQLLTSFKPTMLPLHPWLHHQAVSEDAWCHWNCLWKY